MPLCACTRFLTAVAASPRPHAGGAYWPLATYPCLFFEPSPSAGGGAHRPLTPSCPPSPSLAYPHPPTHPLPFPREVVPPGLSLSHCSVSGPHGGGQRPSPLATCVQVDTHTGGWGGGGGTRPWRLALLACGGAYWPLALEPSAMTSRHPYYCGHPPAWGGGAGGPLIHQSCLLTSLAYPHTPTHPLPFPREVVPRSPRTVPVPLLRVRSTRRRATALAVGHVRPGRHPNTGGGDPSPTAAFGPQDVHLRGSPPGRGRGGGITTSDLPFLAPSPPWAEHQRGNGGYACQIDPHDALEKITCTTGEIWSGHFWYTKFWVPSPPSPLPILLRGSVRGRAVPRPSRWTKAPPPPPPRADQRSWRAAAHPKCVPRPPRVFAAQDPSGRRCADPFEACINGKRGHPPIQRLCGPQSSHCWASARPARRPTPRLLAIVHHPRTPTRAARALPPAPWQQRCRALSAVGHGSSRRRTETTSGGCAQPSAHFLG